MVVLGHRLHRLRREAKPTADGLGREVRRAATVICRLLLLRKRRPGSEKQMHGGTRWWSDVGLGTWVGAGMSLRAERAECHHEQLGAGELGVGGGGRPGGTGVGIQTAEPHRATTGIMMDSRSHDRRVLQATTWSQGRRKARRRAGVRGAAGQGGVGLWRFEEAVG